MASAVCSVGGPAEEHAQTPDRLSPLLTEPAVEIPAARRA